MVIEEHPFTLRYGSQHAKLEETVHDGGWGARLIYREVEEGSGGIVWNRQDAVGDKDKIEKLLFPAYERAMVAIRSVLGGWLYGFRGESERGHILWRDGLSVIVASPQQSYGYLYVTALLEKPDKYGFTDVWDVDEMNAGVAEKAIVISNLPEQRAKLRKPLEEEKELAQRDLERNFAPRARSTINEAELALADFDRLWPRVPERPPVKPAHVIEFPEQAGKRGFDRPGWLRLIWDSKETCIEAGLTPAFQAGGPEDDSLKIEFASPGLMWDGRVAPAEGYAHNATLVVRNFLHPGTTDTVMGAASIEIYDERYVEPLTKAADKINE